MILLEYGANTRTLTVRDNVTISSPEYLFIFINDNTYKKVACTASETVIDDFRSSFTITVQASGDGLNAGISLDDYGFYHYYIYEKTSAQIAAFDYNGVDSIDIRTMTGLLTDGKMRYYPVDTENTYYKDVNSSVKTYGT
jgi:hypothetical protein